MRLLDWIKGKAASETSNVSNPDRWFVDFVNGGKSTSGVSVGPTSAQRCAAVFACVQVLSQDIAKLPLILYKRLPDGGRERGSDHPLYDLMATSPNERMNSFEFREMVEGHLLLRGNAYALIEHDVRGRVVALTPLAPDWVVVLRTPDGDMFYDVRLYGRGKPVRYPAEKILHLRERSEDGFLGKSRITQVRDAIGLAIAAEEHGARLFANGATPFGVLTSDQQVGEDGRRLVKAEFEDAVGGEKKGSVVVMAAGYKYEPITITPEDAQFIDGRKFQIGEIARIFRVPPHKIGDLDKATFSNIEHQAIEYVTDSLMPICRRWEMALNRALLTREERKTYYFEFLLDGLLRGDFKSRMDGYAVARMWGIMNANEIRGLENLNHYDGGDRYLEPSNEWPVDEPRPEKVAAPAGAPAKSRKPRKANGEVHAA